MWNPFALDATALVVWGIVAHLIADWPLQNHWMATNKALRRMRPDTGILADAWRGTPFEGEPGPWWDRHPAAYVHAGIHLLFLAPIFGVAAVPLAIVHLVIDTRAPVAWWCGFIGQTPPPLHGLSFSTEQEIAGALRETLELKKACRGDAPTNILELHRQELFFLEALIDEVRYRPSIPGVVGLQVRFWTDQVFHIATLAAAALVTTLLGG